MNKRQVCSSIFMVIGKAVCMLFCLLGGHLLPCSMRSGEGKLPGKEVLRADLFTVYRYLDLEGQVGGRASILSSLLPW